MKTVLFRLWQWTWGFPQTLLGAVLYLIYRKCPHELYHGAVVTHWPMGGSLGVGMFLFLGKHTDPTVRPRVLVHEYGHAVQSLILGPLFLPIMGIPSFLWCNLKSCKKARKKKGISYYSFYPESTANRLGEAVTKTPCNLK